VGKLVFCAKGGPHIRHVYKQGVGEGMETNRVLGRVWKQKETRENCTLRLFIMYTANMEDESAGAENISGKDKNPCKISVETPKRKIPFQVCS
jgi:hypothetical protein